MPANATPGQPWTTTITNVIDSDNLRVTCSGIAVPASINPVQGQPGSYVVEVAGSNVNCPGPLLVTERVGGREVVHARAEIKPCPVCVG